MNTSDVSGNNAELAAQVDAFLAAWFRTRQTVMDVNFHRAHQQGLSATQFMLMNLLERDGLWTQRSLAASLHLDPTTLLQTVDSLQQRGLVARERSTIDRRRVHIILTDAGRTVQDVSRQRFHAQLSAIFEDMQPAERRALVLGLSAFADAATRPEREGNDATI